MGGGAVIAEGAVLSDLAVVLADGDDDFSAVEVLRSQAAAFGDAASDSTAWRAVAAVAGCELATARLDAARKRVRAAAWITAVRADDSEGAAVAELAGLVDLDGWPDRSRLIVRREPLHPAPPSRLSTTSTGAASPASSPTSPAATWPPWTCATAATPRVEQRIRDLRDIGWANLPSADYAINAVWVRGDAGSWAWSRESQIVRLALTLRASGPGGLPSHAWRVLLDLLQLVHLRMRPSLTLSLVRRASC